MKREVLQKALEEIEEKDGNIDPHKLLEAASNPGHPLHDGWGFDWNLQSAAAKYNIGIARRLIRLRIRVINRTQTIRCVAYVRNPEKEPKEPGYRAISQLRNEKENARETVLRELERVQYALERAQMIAEMLGLSSSFAALLLQVTGLQASIKKTKAA